jgi:hypothetical protein
MSEYLNLQDRIFSNVGKYNIPVIKPVYNVDNIKEWIGFNYAQTTSKEKSDLGVNFFLYDQQFERVWNKPNRYTEFLSQFGAVLSPDFSMYTDFPKAVQIFQHYRKHWVAALWQENGLTVIPTICWSDKESYEWCFDGEPEGGIVAVSNVGCMQNKETRQLFMDGYNEMLTRLQPKEILFFAHTFDDYKGNVHYIRYTMDKGIQA